MTAPLTMFSEARSLCRVRREKKRQPRLFCWSRVFFSGSSVPPSKTPLISETLPTDTLRYSLSQACKRHRELKFFNPKQACCADCLAVGAGIPSSELPTHPSLRCMYLSCLCWFVSLCLQHGRAAAVRSFRYRPILRRGVRRDADTVFIPNPRRSAYPPCCYDAFVEPAKVRQ